MPTKSQVCSINSSGDVAMRATETTTRTVSTTANVSHMTVWRVLGAEGLRRYHAQREHALKATYHMPRVDF
ncbi:hypothetical protein TNCV_5016801 [Trichonephila clavipes]|nr:hypothetical protein TNCV_5016801 [Trichonephila clavipes]